MFRALLVLPVGKPTPALHIGSRMQKNDCVSFIGLIGSNIYPKKKRLCFKSLENQ
jgi:hypothetical protein